MPKIVEFSGGLAKHLQNYISEKHALGYDFIETERVLHKLDDMSKNFDCSNGLPKELVVLFIEKQPHWRERTQTMRINAITNFAHFLIRQGVSAYIERPHSLGKNNEHFEPYIFSKTEISTIFEKVDTLKIKHGNMYHLMYPIIFRIMYSCGLRVSEVIALRVVDVDFKNETLKINDSKNHKDRIVPMSKSLTSCCLAFSEKAHLLSDGEKPFFYTRENTPYASTSVYHFFRSILWKSGISHGGRSQGPRLHDLRHTFAVHCLQKFDEEGIALLVALPLISTYLGHTHWASTGKYLRLTAECFPSINEKLEAIYGTMIPEGGDYNETD